MAKGREKATQTLIYKVILINILIAFYINMEEHGDGRVIGRKHIYNDIKLRELIMVVLIIYGFMTPQKS